MDEPVTVVELAEDEIDVDDAGSTFALGADGWEASDYLEPAGDWTSQPDGSYLSPDGLTRSWPPARPDTV
jgi:hypothetical protein